VTGFWAADLICLGLILTAALLVVGLENLTAAVAALSAVGIVLGVLFIFLQAPDVAHAEVVVGAVALPALYLIAISKIRTVVPDPGDLGEPADREPEDKDEDA
jgi:energy-converting hydrogenase B subunit D